MLPELVATRYTRLAPWALSSGGESAPLIRARSVVRVHQGPPVQAQQGFQRSAVFSQVSGRGALTRLSDVVESFLLSRSVGGCTSRTIALYRIVLRPLVTALRDEVRACTTLAAQTYLSSLRARVKPSTAYRHFSKLRAFFRWGVEAGVLPESPLRGISMMVPKTLPRVPEDEHVQRLLLACDPEAFEGRRNRALVALLADSASASAKPCACASRT